MIGYHGRSRRKTLRNALFFPILTSQKPLWNYCHFFHNWLLEIKMADICWTSFMCSQHVLATSWEVSKQQGCGNLIQGDKSWLLTNQTKPNDYDYDDDVCVIYTSAIYIYFLSPHTPSCLKTNLDGGYVVLNISPDATGTPTWMVINRACSSFSSTSDVRVRSLFSCN